MARALRRMFSVAILLLLGVAAAAAQESLPSRFDGRFEGAIASIKKEAYAPERGSDTFPYEFAISFVDSTVRVFYKNKGKWTDAGKFRLITHKTNAVIVQQESSDSWVETWNFTVTFKDRDTLFVIFTRAVNNFRQAHDYKSEKGDTIGRFFALAFGELKRVR